LVATSLLGRLPGTYVDIVAAPAPVPPEEPAPQQLLLTYTPEVQAAAADAVEALKANPGGFLLCVDCLPDGIPVVYADDLIHHANRLVVDQAAKTDKPVAHYKFLQFGQAAGALDIALRQAVEETKPHAVFCSGTSDALPTLTRLAESIVRSVR
jgi:hypothetical protein